MKQLQRQKPLLICLMGPTASGKTDLAIELAERCSCELISVDSALVYRGLDIGSAKPTYPHHLIDIRDPAQAYSAAEFVSDATTLAAEITARGKTPLLVGGTMLYFKAFLDGLARMPGAHPAIRAEIAEQAAAHGWPYIHGLLAQVDPQAAARIHPNHSQRLSRALEVYRASGVTLTDWHRQPAGPQGQEPGSLPMLRQRYDIVQLAICPWERSVLHQRIGTRFQSMLEAGLLNEVRQLREREDLHPALPAVRAVGYRQFWQYLDGECGLDEAIEHAIAATRQLAKRQLTWLRKWPDTNWIYTDAQGNLHECGLSQFPDVVPGEKPHTLALNYLAPPPL